MAKIEVTLTWKSSDGKGEFEPKFNVLGLTEDDEVSFTVMTDKGKADTFKLKFNTTPSAIPVPEITEVSTPQVLKACASESKFHCEAGNNRGGTQLPPVGGRTKK